MAEGERRVCVWCVHTNVCSCSTNVILCRGQKRMSMSCFIPLYLVSLRHHLSLNLELICLPSRLSDSPVSIPYPVHKTDGIPPTPASSVGMGEFYSDHMRAQQALLNTVLPPSSGLLLSLLLFVGKSQTFRVTRVGWIYIWFNWNIKIR